MKRFSITPFLCAVALSVLIAGHSTGLSPDTKAGEQWWDYVKYLADDQLEGRNTGSEGHRKAADYVAHHFASDGLEPAGINGYIQPVPFIAIRVDQDRSKAALLRNGSEIPLTSGDDVLLSSRIEWHGRVEAPLVFVGYGLDAASAGYNDFAGVDLKGKIAVYLTGAGPSTVPGNLRAHFGSARERWKALQAAGAIGTVTISNPKKMDIPWSRQRNNASQAGMLLADPELQGTRDEKVAISLNPAIADKLFEGSGHTFEEILAAGESGKPLPHFDIGCSLRVDPVAQRSEVTSQNVAGILRGSDANLRDQYVVLTAHLDHLGIGKPINGDAIFNGAMDNASGVASLLEMAAELKASGKRPRRSLLFVVVTGEEKGLLGSEYFTAHPTVPTNSMVADINIDMFLPIHALEVLTVFGLHESSLGNVVEKIAAAHQIRVEDDPQPERNIFIRSDQYNFILHGVPAVMCAVGAANAEEGKIDMEWLRTRYHAPSDDVNQPVDLQAAALYNELILETALAVANNSGRPSWSSSSFFRPAGS